MTENCGNCKFLMETSESAGYCRRYPQQVVLVNTKDGYGEIHQNTEFHWPFMDKKEWCGEHKPPASDRAASRCHFCRRQAARKGMNPEALDRHFEECTHA
jgi:hypothetical protein